LFGEQQQKKERKKDWEMVLCSDFLLVKPKVQVGG
jgi:hypothetical protein